MATFRDKDKDKDNDTDKFSVYKSQLSGTIFTHSVKIIIIRKIST